MAASIEEGTEMKRRKRFTIRLVALGLAVAALSAAPAQARLDEGLNGLQPLTVHSESLVTADDIGRPTPAPSQPLSVHSQSLVTADDIGRPTPAPSQPIVVASDDGIETGSLAMSGIVLLLGAGAAFVAVHQARKGRLASA
jgi:hypothetical protein